MPNPTFFNLAEEKRRELIRAAYQEFSRAPFAEALIANIVKSAGISRGSFYQYFEDKEDLYFYLLNKHAEKSKERFYKSLKERDGDLMEAFVDMFQQMLEKFDNAEYRGFFQNTFLNMNHRIENTFTRSFDKEKYHAELVEISEQVDREKINFSSDKEFIHMVNMTRAITFRHMMKHFANQESSKEEAIEDYRFDIELLKRGFSK